MQLDQIGEGLAVGGHLAHRGLALIDAAFLVACPSVRLGLEPKDRVRVWPWRRTRTRHCPDGSFSKDAMMVLRGRSAVDTFLESSGLAVDTVWGRGQNVANVPDGFCWFVDTSEGK